jgi:hypothetical protein
VKLEDTGMSAFIRVLACAGAAAILLAGARAETFSDKALGFSAAFPCRSIQTSQTVIASFGKVPVTSLSCAKGKDIYIISVSRYPKGFVAKRNHVYRDAVNGAAANVKGSVRSNKAFKLGAVTGRDVLIDVPADRAAAHMRVFFSGDRQYQVTFLGPKGHESGKAAMGFLNSFRLRK